MLRRSLWVSSLAVLVLARGADAAWTDWTVNSPGNVFALETASASAGPGAYDRCVTYGYLELFGGFSGEVWCEWSGLGFSQVNSIPTAGDPSVAMDAALNSGTNIAPPFFAISDPDSAQVWYGIAGQTPELALQGVVARSLSLAHFSDGTPLLVFRGTGDRIYTASRKPTGEWSTMQLTNNTSGDKRWSVDAVVVADVVHITYWDDTWKDIRYARREGATWTFETVKDFSSGVDPGFFSPSVGSDERGRAVVAYAGKDGLLHVQRRSAPNTWSDATFTAPAPLSHNADRGPVGLTVDGTGLEHIVFGTGNVASDEMKLYYVNKPALGSNNFAGLTLLQQVGPNEPEGYTGVDLVRKPGPGPFNSRLLASWSVSFVGILGLGCGNCN